MPQKKTHRFSLGKSLRFFGKNRRFFPPGNLPRCRHTPRRAIHGSLDALQLPPGLERGGFDRQQKPGQSSEMVGKYVYIYIYIIIYIYIYDIE